MTIEEYTRIISDWCVEVRTEALRLFESGCDPIECTGLAINVVESRRRNSAKALQRLMPGSPRGH